MANIRKRDPRESTEMGRSHDPYGGRAEPWSLMQRLMGWDPFGNLESFLPGGRGTQGFIPEVELKETKDGYVFKADLPGVKESDIDVSITGNRITISGKREEEEEVEDARYYAYECGYGSFSRSFTLPEGANVDGIKADMKDGVLTVTVPKRPEVQPRRISVGGSTQPGMTSQVGQTPAFGEGSSSTQKRSKP